MEETLELPKNITLAQVDDPQRSLVDGRVAAIGFHTVFANMREGDCTWSMPISFEVKAEAQGFHSWLRIGSVNRLTFPPC